MNIVKIALVISLGLTSALSMAAGYGVDTGSSQQGSASSINQLLDEPNGSVPVVGQSQMDAAQKPDALSIGKIRSILKNQAAESQATGDSALAPVGGTQTQSQAATVAQAPQDTSFGSDGMSQRAFANMVNSVMPMSPQQIKTLRTLFDRSKHAAAIYPGGTPPKPTSSAVVVDLSPGSAPPVIRLRNGFITSLVFLDSTGEPWPIQAYDIGDPNSFNVQWNQKSNTLLVQSDTTYKSGNLAIMLKGQDTPVMVTLLPGQKAVDYRVDLRVPGFGPYASPTISNLPGTANPKLINFLNGIPPQGAKTLEVLGAPAEGWEFGGHIFLRTRLTVLSPSWLASMSSPDGTHVYEITKSPVVLASFRGKIVQLTIQGY